MFIFSVEPAWEAAGQKSDNKVHTMEYLYTSYAEFTFEK